jgi:hypothetical protein
VNYENNGCWTRLRRVAGAGILILAASPGRADAPADKSGYHLFHPTPPDQMRELSTDRPDQTESAFTVDAGHFQVEMDMGSATFDHDRAGGGNAQTTAWGTLINLKAGLLNNADIQFVIEPYVQWRSEDLVGGVADESSGVGDFQTRLKVNLWGNDGGKTALAVMPYVKWPLPASSLRNGETEGGVIIPLAVELPLGWGMGLMTEFDFVADGSSGFDTEYFNTITLSHDLAGNLGGYIEFAALVTPEGGGEWQGQADLGFTYALNANTQFDLGCNFGVTSSAPDYAPFIGIALRF